MTTAARPYRQTLGHSLAAKLQKPRRTVRPKRPRVSLKSEGKSRSRSAKRDAEVKRVVWDVEVLAAERAIERSSVGREILRLTDERTKARFQEQLAGLGLVTAQQDAERCRKHHSQVCSRGRYAEFESAWGKLQDSETELRVWQQRHAGYVHARELIDAELSLLARAAR